MIVPVIALYVTAKKHSFSEWIAISYIFSSAEKRQNQPVLMQQLEL